MKYIVEPFYLIIWILIKIGDSVLFVLSSPAKINFSLPKHSFKKTRTIKKKAVLFKTDKKRRRKHFSFLTFSKIRSKVYATLLKRRTRAKVSQYARKTRTTSSKSLSFLKTVFMLPIVLLKILATFIIRVLQVLLNLSLAFLKLVRAVIWGFLTLVKKLFLAVFKALKVILAIVFFPLIVIYRFNKKRQAKHAYERALKEELRLQKKLRRRRPTFWYTVKIFFWGSAFSAIFIFIPFVVLIFLSDLPNPSALSTTFIPKTTKIYDRNNTLLYEIFATQNRTVVHLDQIPKDLQHATIAIEDRDFYTHPGFDIRGILRAGLSNIQNNNLQGGSTITQQLIKSALLTPEPSISRKAKEIVLAFWAERIYSKEKILELYFNYVPYGGTAWGVQAASEVYFGKPIEDLDLAQSAFLAGLPRAPSIYSPYSDGVSVWKKRQKEVLSAMQKMGYITSSQAKTAGSEKLSFVGPNVAIRAPHFVMYVKNLLIQKYGLSEVERGGLQVKTTLDLKTQNMVEQTVEDEVNHDAYLNISNGASVVLDPRNGDILAMVGSKNYFDLENDGNVNLTTSLRQPGSTIKVVTYSLALSSGFTQASLIDDGPLTITPQSGPAYTPVNYDGKFHGNVPLRLAFANSFNITAVRVAQKLGVENIVDQGKRMGITSWNNPEDYGLSITLGGADTTMLDLATVYSTVANAGKRVSPDPILEVKDSFGETLYQKEPTESQVLSPGVAFIVGDILSDNKARSIEFGSNSPLNIPNHRVSVKTGTTDNKRDNWTVGFTPNIVVATWVGNNDNSPMSQALASGITGAAPMWNKIMTNILQTRPEGPLFVPEDLVKKPCLGFDMYFLRGTEATACIAPVTPSPSSPATALAR